MGSRTTSAVTVVETIGGADNGAACSRAGPDA